MNQLNVLETPISDLKIVERWTVEDDRGCFSRMFCANDLGAVGWEKPVAQINHSYTARQGTVRGFHYQKPPFAETKLVSCIAGEIWDVAVDLRKDSPTFLNHFGVYLTADNGRALLIPEGFAHGFQTTTDEVHLLYCHSEFYAPGAEGGVSPEDTALGVEWPIDVTLISDRDKALPCITPDFEGLSI